MTKVTIKSIAKDLNLSRNTVSMAMKESPKVAPETRHKILTYAASVGYSKLIPEAVPVSSPDRPLRVLALRRPDNTVYWDKVINGLSEEASLNNCIVNIAVVTQENIGALQLPQGYSDDIDACLFLHKFGYPYTRKILSGNKVGIFLDQESYAVMEPVLGDVIKSEGLRSTMELTSSLIHQGMHRIAFLSPYYVDCETFCDRYQGYCLAMQHAGIPIQSRYVIASSSHTNINLAIEEALNQFLPDWPEAIVCVNDICAVRVSEQLIKRGFKIPDDIAITGYDNDELNSFQPFFTTVDCNANLLGKRMVQQLLWRIKHPDAPLETITISGQVIYRKSSQKISQS